MKLKIENGTILELYTSSEIVEGEKRFSYHLSYKGKKLANIPNDNVFGLEPDKLESIKNAIHTEVRDGNLYASQKCIVKGVSLIQDVFGHLEKDNDSIKISFEDLVLCQCQESEFPEGLFARRNSFVVHIIDDNTYKVIRYANLHQHSEYSLLDAIVKVNDIAENTEYACALTDHGNMYGHREFYNAMIKRNKKPIIGVEAYIEELNDETVPDDEKELLTYKRKYFNRNHLILLAKDNTGLRNLYKLVSVNEDHIYNRPHITYDDLEKYHEGIICTSACMSGPIGKAIQKRDYQLAEKVIEKLKAIFGDDFYMELQNHKFEEEDFIMNMIAVLAKKHGVKTTIGIDAHYLKPEDAYAHELWLCNVNNKKITDPTHRKYSGEGYYMMDSDEVVELFKDYPEALDNSLEIADKCNVKIEFEGYHLPDFQIPKEFKTQADYLTHLCRQGYKKLFYGTDKFRNPVYVDRMKEELRVITGYAKGEYNPNADWSGYMLIVQDFLNWAKQNGIYVGPGRGSAAGSLVAYCLGITSIDPIEYGLLFERFMSPDRISMPEQYWAFSVNPITQGCAA